MDKKKVNIRPYISLISFTVILSWSLFNLPLVASFFRRILDLLRPFIIGGALAFIFYNPMSFFEEKLFKRLGLDKKWKRLLSYILSLLIFIAVGSIIVFLILPEIKNSLVDLADKLPELVGEAEKFIMANLSNNKDLISLINKLGLKWIDLNEKLMEFIGSRALDWMNSSFKLASSLVSAVATGLVAFVFSIYILFQREELGLGLRRLTLAFTTRERAERIFYIARLSSTSFSRFLTGQLTESIIIGLMFFLAMLAFKFPYALVVSIIIGLSSLIPLVGSFIGLGLGLFLIILVDLSKAFSFLILFIIIQQLEGNLIYPRVVGKASGLPSIWVLVAVSLGGNIMGILGIILFIPLGAIIYSLVTDLVDKRLREKDIELKL